MASVLATLVRGGGTLVRPRADRSAGIRSWNIPRLPLLVFFGYAVGAQVGMVLRLPETIPSVMWPPNAILTTALLFTPPRRWWIIFASALPAHILIELGAWPWPLVLALFVTNCTEAMIAGLMVRRFSDAPSQFNTLPRVTTFLFWGALFAPLTSSFFDAAVASAFGGQDYWAVWNTRFPSNVLGAIAIVPALSGALNTSSVRLRAWPRRRWFEAAKIGSGLAIAALVISTDVGNAGFAPVPLTLFLPFLLWAAVKFGTAGAGLSLLATVLVVVEAAVYGHGLLDMVPADDRVRVLQVALIVVAVPLMCLAALVEERRRAESELRGSHVLKSAILKSLPSHVAVLDRDGRIIAVNDSWSQFDRTGAGGRGTRLGASYLDVCAAAARDGEAAAAAAFEGVRDVLDGTRATFSMEYPLQDKGRETWWVMRVVPLKRPAGGALVTHTDMTDRYKAELEARQSREELAHLSRVFVLGELTASFSHQLSQPLTAIVGNAQAGRRFLDARPLNRVELQHIFTDILADSSRAAELIRGLRDMLRKGATEHVPLRINEMVEETCRILTSDAIIRGVSVRLELAASLPLVEGDRVQLQQVVLNLLVNAMDAVVSLPLGPRVVTVRTESNGPDGMTISVIDSGPGLPDAGEGIFDPFYTTKPSGTGVGLSIARTIVEAHRGTIHAHNRQEGGAVFHVRLPSMPTD